MITGTNVFNFECWPVGGGYLKLFVFRAKLVNQTFDAFGNVTNLTGTGDVWVLPIFPDSIELKENEKENATEKENLQMTSKIHIKNCVTIANGNHTTRKIVGGSLQSLRDLAKEHGA